MRIGAVALMLSSSAAAYHRVRVAAYGFGGIGRIIGKLGLALIVGASDVITHTATVDAIVPSFMYFAGWMALCGLAFLSFGFETEGEGISRIDQAPGQAVPVPVRVRR